MVSRLGEGRAWQEGTNGLRKPAEAEVRRGFCNARVEGLSFSRGDRVVERGSSELRVLKEIKSDVGGSSVRICHTSGQW